MQPSPPPSIAPPSQEPLVNYLRKYLAILNDTLRKEKRFAILNDLIEVTPNSQSLQYRLAILEREGYIARFDEGRETRFIKTEKGTRLEHIINEDWEYVVHLNENWQGKEMRKHY